MMPNVEVIVELSQKWHIVGEVVPHQLVVSADNTDRKTHSRPPFSRIAQQILRENIFGVIVSRCAVEKILVSQN